MSAAKTSEPAVAADLPRVSCTGCSKETEAKMSCPTCRKLELPPAFFCGQDCFKTSWPKHSVVHKLVKAIVSQDGSTVGLQTMAMGFAESDPQTWRTDAHLRRFIRYEFSGDLRPWPTPAKRTVPRSIACPDYANDKDGIAHSEQSSKRGAHIEIQTPEKIEALRKCCRLAREALDLAGRMVKPGVTTEAIDLAVHNFCVENNAYPSPLNYFKFPKSCCTSVNEIICHGIPDLRPLQDGDIVNIDITLFHGGVHGDLNETFMVGENVDDESKRLVQGAYDCLMAAVVKCKPGFMYREIGDTVHAVADKLKLSVVRGYCGHGIGELFHTTPNVPHYRKNKTAGIMKAGHCFTIEPMINLGTHRDELWPDDWTAPTADGKRSAQFEHTLLITETGVEVLTARLPTSPSLGIDAWTSL